MPTELTTENVQRIVLDCLFKEGEDTSKAVIAEGVIGKFGFNPERLESHKKEIGEMLDCLPDNFKEGKGGGWSFLNACYTKDGVHCGEHVNMDELFILGMATGQVECKMPRKLWSILPGGMPYYSVKECDPS